MSSRRKEYDGPVSKPKQQRLNPSDKIGGKGTRHPSGNPARRNQAPASAADWVSGARLRTLPLAIAPVAAGTGAAAALHGFNLVIAILCLIVALCLQIGVNYSNDYSDGVRGTDTHRLGPPRLTGSGAADPKRVLAVALAFFGLAGLAGLAVVVISGQYWMLLVGAAAIVAAWFYTGGRRPYGYYGLGEVFVFVFFGLVATVGTTFVQAGDVNLESWLCGVALGLVACAVLMINNIRDAHPDRAAGKKTLAVLIGRWPSRILYCVFLLLPYVIVGFISLLYPLAFLTFFTLLLAIPAVIIALTGTTSRELILALKLTSFSSLALGLGLGAALAF